MARLHSRLLHVARREIRRRNSGAELTGPELNDLAHQATADAVVLINQGVGDFRDESRFTTWTYKFVIFEVSNKLGRHFWKHHRTTTEVADWDQLPARFGSSPSEAVEFGALVEALAVLHVYAEIVAAGEDPELLCPGVTAHLRACGPCAEDLHGLLEAIRASS